MRLTAEMRPYSLRALIAGSAGVFLSAGAVPLKALWDAHLLERAAPAEFVAFSLLFPVIVAINAFAGAFANAVSSTFVRWQWLHEGRIDGIAMLLVSTTAVALGALLGLALAASAPALSALFGAASHLPSIRGFLVISLAWLPLQFLSVATLSFARGTGMFARAGASALCGYALSMVLSWLLIVHRPLTWLDAIECVALTNAVAAATFNLLMFGLLVGRHRFFIRRLAGAGAVARRMLVVGANGLLANLFALMFIFTVMVAFSRLDEHYIAATGYLFRLEQLALTVFFVMSAVIVPHAAHTVRSGSGAGLVDLIRTSTTHFVLLGIISLAVLLAGFIVLADRIVADDVARDVAVRAALLWFPAYLLQGLCMLYTQILGVVLDAASPLLLGFVRFIALGVPAVLVVSSTWGGNGLICVLPILHLLSLVFVVARFRHVLRRFALRLMDPVKR